MKFKNLAVALAAASGLLALSAVAPIQSLTSPAYAQRACNVLYSGKECVKCAQGRGYTPKDYCSYCGNPNVKECSAPKKQPVKK